MTVKMIIGLFAIMLVLNLQMSQAQEADRFYYELRRYEFNDQGQKEATLTYLGSAFIPALNKMGIEPVGVFEPLEEEVLTLYMLIPYASPEMFAEVIDKLAGDNDFNKAAAGYLKRPLKEPGYQRMHSSFMKSFEAVPGLILPDGKDHIVELRIYESHNQFAGNQKVKMFNQGEIDIFYETGLIPVFFGQTLVGENLPNLTYMLTFKSLQDRRSAWDRFKVHPEWLQIKEEPEYIDTVSKVSSYLLKPVDISQF